MARPALLLILLAPLAAAQPFQSVLVEDDRVWAKWSLTSNLLTKAEVEQGQTVLVAGAHDRPAFILVNNHSAPIRNVTLVIIPRNLTLDNYVLSNTYAGEPPTGNYAFWRLIRPDNGGFVPLDLWVSPDARGPFVLEAFVTFTAPDGNISQSTTRIHGTVMPQRDEVPAFSFPLAVLGLLLASAAPSLVRRRRQ